MALVNWNFCLMKFAGVITLWYLDSCESISFHTFFKDASAKQFHMVTDIDTALHINCKLCTAELIFVKVNRESWPFSFKCLNQIIWYSVCRHINDLQIKIKFRSALYFIWKLWLPEIGNSLTYFFFGKCLSQTWFMG